MVVRLLCACATPKSSSLSLQTLNLALRLLRCLPSGIFLVSDVNLACLLLSLSIYLQAVKECVQIPRVSGFLQPGIAGSAFRSVYDPCYGLVYVIFSCFYVAWQGMLETSHRESGSATIFPSFALGQTSVLIL